MGFCAGRDMGMEEWLGSSCNRAEQGIRARAERGRSLHREIGMGYQRWVNMRKASLCGKYGLVWGSRALVRYVKPPH